MARGLAPLLALVAVLWAGRAAAAEPQAKAAPKAAPKELQPHSEGWTKPGDHRLIVRYAAPDQPSAKEEGSADLQRHVDELASREGVVHAQALPRLGMAVLRLATEEQRQDLAEALREDPVVEVAVPDTWVSLSGVAGGDTERGASASSAAAGAASHSASEAVAAAITAAGSGVARQCSANPACRMRGLPGECCPAPSGVMLSCCNIHSPERIVLQTATGAFVEAQESGEVVAVNVSLSDACEFVVIPGPNHTVALLGPFGRYLSAESSGVVRADRASIEEPEQFILMRNSDHTISFRTHFDTYLTAEPSGAVVADSERVSESEMFTMLQQPSSVERFSDDPGFPRLWGMHSYRNFDIDAPEAWKIWTGEVGRGITVAVIDTGIDYTHDDLREQMWVNPLEIPNNGIDDDGNGYVDDVHGVNFNRDDGDPYDDNMHGTHCAGTIASVGNNGVGVTGVAWRGVRLMALKFLDGQGDGRTSDAIRALEYAVAHGAQVTSNSWGGGASSSALRVAIERAEAAGVLFTAAAGNEGSNNDEVASFPANFDIPNIITVASTDEEGELSPFSCFGNHTVHVAAPGSRILSTTPGGYSYLSGTSMAAPHVSGLAALVWMYRPQLSMHQVRSIVIGSVAPLRSLEGKVITSGLINAKNALEAAWAFEPPRPPALAPEAIRFEDVDPRIGAFGGVVTIQAAANESDIDYYRVYFVSGAGYQLHPLGDAIPALRLGGGGAVAPGRELALALNGSFARPRYAKYLVAVSGSAAGERPAQLDTAPHVELEDYGLPESGPRGAEWLGDEDLREGFIAGTFLLNRSSAEPSLTHYNVYWRGSDDKRGPLAATVAATGFQEPVCSGRTCSSISMSKTADGAWLFENMNYGSDESAVIRTSGPGTLVFTHFDTEQYYDYLLVGQKRMYGDLSKQFSMPHIMELPEGPIELSWSSDMSIQGSGWAFELRQDGGVARQELGPMKVEGEALEVVAAFGRFELEGESQTVEVVDFTRTMPPSPAFAPLGLRALRENGGDLCDGASLDGLVEVVPAEKAPRGGIDFYQVDLADAQGRVLDTLDGAPLGAWRIDANSAWAGDRWTVEVKAQALPSDAKQLIARAGNKYGLGATFASLGFSQACQAPDSETETPTRQQRGGRHGRHLSGAPALAASPGRRGSRRRLNDGARAGGLRPMAEQVPWPGSSNLQGILANDEDHLLLRRRRPRSLRSSRDSEDGGSFNSDELARRVIWRRPDAAALGTTEAALRHGVLRCSVALPTAHPSMSQPKALTDEKARAAVESVLASQLQGAVSRGAVIANGIEVSISRVVLVEAPAQGNTGGSSLPALADTVRMEFEVSALSAIDLDRAEAELLLLSSADGGGAAGSAHSERFGRRLAEALGGAGGLRAASAAASFGDGPRFGAIVGEPKLLSARLLAAQSAQRPLL